MFPMFNVLEGGRKEVGHSYSIYYLLPVWETIYYGGGYSNLNYETIVIVIRN